MIENFNNKKESFFYVIDASNKKIGRISTYIKDLLLQNCNSKKFINNYIFVFNANKLFYTRKKGKKIFLSNKKQRPGNLKKISFKNLFSINPSQILYNSIINMLPKNPSTNNLHKYLYIYNDNNLILSNNK